MPTIHQDPTSTTAAGKAAPRFRTSALLETALFIAAVLVIDFAYFGGDRFATVEPHPFWVIVLLVSAQYGTREGLIAAAFSSVALLVWNVPDRGLAEDFYQYSFSLFVRPTLWVLMAVVIGEIRVRHIRQRDELIHRVDDADAKVAELRDAYMRTNHIRLALETRVAGQVRTAMTMYQAARAMEKLDPTEVLLGVMDVVRAVLNPSKYSIYLLEGNQLECSIGEGWQGNEPFSRSLGPDSAIFREVIVERTVLCSANPEHEGLLGAEGVLAGPLVDNESGNAIGMLKIEEVGFLDLHFSNVQTFDVLCQWVGDSYMNAVRYQSAREDMFIDRETQLLSYSFFARQKDFIVELATRLGFDVSMIVLEIENPHELSPEELRVVPAVIRDSMRTEFRSTDLVFDYGNSSIRYTSLLPATDVPGAEVVASKLRETLGNELGARAPSARLRIESHPVHEIKNSERSDAA